MSILFALYFVIPAVVLADALTEEEASSPWDLAAGLGLAVLALGWIGFAVCLITGDPYSHATLLLINGLFALVGAARRRSISRRARRWLRPRRPGAEDAVVLVLLVAAFLAAMLLFRTDQYSNTCLHQSLAYAVGLPVETLTLEGTPREGVGSLLTITNREREGTFSMIAPFALLWGFFGLRLFFACAVALCGVFGYLAARRLLQGGPAARVLVALLFSAFPFGADILWNDTNTVAFLCAAALLYLAGSGPRGAWVLGASFGLLFATRHVAIVSAAGPLLWWLQRSRGGRVVPALIYGATFLLVASPLLVHHAVAFGSPLSYESFAEYGPHPHRLLGLEFTLHGMLNVPFYGQLVRTPFNPLPVMFLMPLWLLSRLGVVLAALGLVGAAATLRRGGRATLPAALYVVPYAAVLAVNENWMQVEKMGAVAPLLPVAFLAMGHGAATVWRQDAWWRRGALLLAAMTLVFGAATLLARADAPLDRRFFDEHPWMRPERPAYLEAERVLLPVRLWPSPEWPRLSAVQPPLARLRRALGSPGYEGRPVSPRERMLQQLIPRTYKLHLAQHGAVTGPPAPGTGGAVRYVVDLSRPWVARNGWLRPAAGPLAGPNVTLDLVSEGGARRHDKFPLPAAFGEGQVATLAAFHHDDAVYVVLAGPSRHEVVRVVGGDAEFAPRTTARGRPLPGDRFGLLVPAGVPLRVIEVLSLDPSRIYIWQLPAGDGVARLEGPIHWRHN